MEDKRLGVWFCKECGRPINEGYSWNGLCVVCAEEYLNDEYVASANNSEEPR